MLQKETTITLEYCSRYLPISKSLKFVWAIIVVTVYRYRPFLHPAPRPLNENGQPNEGSGGGGGGLGKNTKIIKKKKIFKKILKKIF